MSAVTAAFPGSGHASTTLTRWITARSKRKAAGVLGMHIALMTDVRAELGSELAGPRGEAAATRRMILLAQKQRRACIPRLS